ncbi:hypothetical protein D0869_06218 [Hortaea werneckii]|uniref:NAD-dependent epimerase/dehydratase domain-containing protein n=1 Tax=Hortaea werneckii TaxID=91943 RepID=A0A3M6WUG1_HORWE|nr:hypothetical protein D0869_06218 [Hortaea werneckii]RMY12038.1 hypothetical protein D0868_02798 [Hortaea werneckii]RMY20190.1 hypothetical protein D0867_04174 [Hortaea werneckii]RMY37963.1 hypothetical protein D0866_02918 [Hortaea werneckii]
MPQKTAYITGGGSGIGRAVTAMLVNRGFKVAIADLNYTHAKDVATALGPQVIAYEADAASWDSQTKAFQQALEDLGGRVDFVCPIAGIGEKRSIPNDPTNNGFVKPNLACLDVDLYGVTYTLPSQHQCAAVTVYQVALPIYTAAKHGVVGLTRSYGTYLPEEHMTLNAVCPNVVRTSISTGEFHDKLEAKGLLTPMSSVVNAFEKLLDGKFSGQCLEAGPNGGIHFRQPAEHLDRETAELMELLYERAHPLHQPVSQE